MDGYKYKKSEKGYFLPINESDPSGDNQGLVQRSIRNLIAKVLPLKKTRSVTLNVSFLQIYNEKIYDLLNPGMFKKNKGDGLVQPAFHNNSSQNLDPTGLKLKWNPFDVYTVENLFNFSCVSEAEIVRLFNFGLRNKVIGSHKMNLTSSRSHTIFSIHVEQINMEHPDSVIISKL